MLQKEELSMLFKGRYHDNNAIVALHPGAGLEAQDWAEMLCACIHGGRRRKDMH